LPYRANTHLPLQFLCGTCTSSAASRRAPSAARPLLHFLASLELRTRKGKLDSHHYQTKILTFL